MDVVDLHPVGMWGRSLRDPALLSDGDLDLPESSSFSGWAKAQVGELPVWLPLDGSQSFTGCQAVVADSGDRAAVGFNDVVVCLDLLRAEVLHVAHPISPAFLAMRPLTPRSVLAVFLVAVAEVSLDEGLLWEFSLPDAIADYAFQRDAISLVLEDESTLVVDPNVERRRLRHLP